MQSEMWKNDKIKTITVYNFFNGQIIGGATADYDGSCGYDYSPTLHELREAYRFDQLDGRRIM
jgi:hypothetical protein